MITLQIDSKKLQDTLASLERAGQNLRPALHGIATELRSQTEENFAEQGRPRWEPLARSTIEKRVHDIASGSKSGYRKDGRISKSVANTASGMRMLQVSAGGLSASITTEVGTDFVAIGSAKVYAAIHQLGGQAGRGRKVRIPARPYLPFTGEADSGTGQLQPQAEEAILDIVLAHLNHAAGG